ncbi:MAG TPA: hypothetical protein VJ872_08645 [Nocardioides sp.]|nr:hypothetical protein [Nocardioides sp.]
MVWLAGDTAIVTGGTSPTGRAMVEALVGAGARVAVVDTDEAALARMLVDLAVGSRAVPVHQVPGAQGRTWAAAEAAIGPVTIVCDVAGGVAGVPLSELPFRLCRWTQRSVGAAAATVLSARPVSGLAAMALLIPGALPGRVDRSHGVVAAALHGHGRNRNAVEDEHPVLVDGAAPTELARQLVELVPARGTLICTSREWEGRCEPTASTEPTTPLALRLHHDEVALVRSAARHLVSA